MVLALLVVGVPFGARALFENASPTEAHTTTEPATIGLEAIEPVTTPETIEHQTEPEKPTTVASRMTGVQVAPELDELPVTGVMIENELHARPQAGLAQADMVYEALVEGGITRFLALFQESQPARIGPVRSVRPYYLDFLLPYDAAIAHTGGSTEALAQIRNQGIPVIFSGDNISTFERSTHRAVPHNAYTSRAKLLAAQNHRGYLTSTYAGLARKPAETPVTVPNARAIDFTMSSALYNPHFDYDSTSNSYRRSQGGTPHLDEQGSQISPKVVVALVVTHGYAGIYSQCDVNRGGVAYVFQDGTVVQGAWTKPYRRSQLVLSDATGAVLPLDPGQTWLTLVAGPADVRVAP